MFSSGNSYTLNLADWISIGMNKDTLEHALDVINSNRPQSEIVIPVHKNLPYKQKILREEIQKQFENPLRPSLEVVLNAIDAKPADADSFDVNVRISRRSLTVEDSGQGLSLDGLLKQLIIPFLSEKTGESQIGQFGVGFLSTFNYLLERPKKAKIIVETKSENNTAYQVTFYSNTNDATDIEMNIHRSRRKKPGTKVEIKSLYNKTGTFNYLRNGLSQIPLYVSPIIIDKKTVNKGEREWYSHTVNLSISGLETAQQVGFSTSPSASSGSINVTSQGVPVVTRGSDVNIRQNVSIRFPSGVKVVEGRDEFKVDENYKIARRAAFKAFGNYVRDNELTSKFTTSSVNLIPGMASILNLQNLAEIPDLDELCSTLLPGKEYVLTRGQAGEFTPFLGDEGMENTFVADHFAISYWSKKYSTKVDLVNSLKNEATFCKPKDIPSKFPNIIQLAGLVGIKSEKEPSIGFIDLGTHGTSPVHTYVEHVLSGDIVIHKPKILVNVAHPYVNAPANSTLAYAILGELSSNDDFWDNFFEKRGSRDQDKIVKSLSSGINSYYQPIDRWARFD